MCVKWDPGPAGPALWGCAQANKRPCTYGCTGMLFVGRLISALLQLFMAELRGSPAKPDQGSPARRQCCQAPPVFIYCLCIIGFGLGL